MKLAILISMLPRGYQDGAHLTPIFWQIFFVSSCEGAPITSFLAAIFCTGVQECSYNQLLFTGWCLCCWVLRRSYHKFSGKLLCWFVLGCSYCQLAGIFYGVSASRYRRILGRRLRHGVLGRSYRSFQTGLFVWQDTAGEKHLAWCPAEPWLTNSAPKILHPEFFTTNATPQAVWRVWNLCVCTEFRCDSWSLWYCRICTKTCGLARRKRLLSLSLSLFLSSRLKPHMPASP
jgi:hypothetical protein